MVGAIPSLLERLRAALAPQYEVERELASGGIGTVFLARDPNLDRPVAIKILRPDLASDTASDRFLREARILARLSHPNVVPVFQAGQAGGLSYYVMEYVEGATLKDRLEHGAMPKEGALKLADDLLSALAEAHKHGIVHRDVKPGNIFLVGDRALLGDFGIAKQTGESATGLTAPGRGVGTPDYMPPEQIAGAATPRTDLYAVGMVLYEALTGRRWSIADPTAEVDWSGVAPELLHVLRRALAWSPEERWSNAEAFRRALAGTPRSRAAAATERARLEASSIRQLFTWRNAIGAGVLALVAGGVVATGLLLLGDKTDGQGTVEAAAERKSIAVLPFNNMSAEAENEYFSDGITDDIITQLSMIADLKVISRQSSMQYKGSEKNLRRIAEELGVATILEGGVQRIGDRVRINAQLIDAETDEHLWAEQYNREVTDVFAIQSDVAQQIAAALKATLTPAEKDRIEVTPTENVQAYEVYLRGKEYMRRGLSEADARLAVRMFQQAVHLDPELALAYAHLSIAHSRIWWFHWDRSPQRLDSAGAAVERALELEPDLAEANEALGWYYYWGYLDYERALAAFQEALTAQPTNSGVLFGIGSVRRRQGRMKETLARFREAAELDPRNWLIANDLGETYLLVRDFPLAERHLDRAISLAPHERWPYWWKAQLYVGWKASTEKARAVLQAADEAGVDHPWLAYTAVWLDVLEHDFEAALDALAHVPSDAYDFQNFYVPESLVRARIHGLAGHSRLAEAYYDSTRVTLEGRIASRPRDARLHSSLGIAYAGLGRKDDAIRQGKRGVELLPVSIDAFEGVYRLGELAQIYAAVGESQLAIDTLDQLLSIPGVLTVQLLRIDPIWDPLREDPRFQALLEREQC